MRGKQKNYSGRLPQFMPGDIVLFAGRHDLYSRVSRWLMRSDLEGPTYAVHAAQFIDNHRVLEMDVVGKVKTVDDLLNNRVDLNTWDRRGFEVWRCRTLTPEQRRKLTRELFGYVNIRFGGLKMFAHLFDGLIRKVADREVYFFRRLGKYPVCSGITSETYHKALGYTFGVPAECADPDNLHDWMRSHPEEWERVFTLKEFPTTAKNIQAAPAG